MNAIAQGASDYWNDIPHGTIPNIVYAAGGGFFLETILSGNVSQGAIVAGLSALATTIHALVTPIFKSLTGGRMQLTWQEEVCRTFSGIIGAAVVAKAFGNDSILKKLWIEAVFELLIIHTNPSRSSLLQTNVITIIPDFRDFK